MTPLYRRAFLERHKEREIKFQADQTTLKARYDAEVQQAEQVWGQRKQDRKRKLDQCEAIFKEQEELKKQIVVWTNEDPPI